MHWITIFNLEVQSYRAFWHYPCDNQKMQLITAEAKANLFLYIYYII